MADDNIIVNISEASEVISVDVTETVVPVVINVTEVAEATAVVDVTEIAETVSITLTETAEVVTVNISEAQSAYDLWLALGNTGSPEEFLEAIGDPEMLYTRRVDFYSDTVIYKGYAAAGALEASAVWRVKRVTLAVDGDVTEEWANGSTAFSNIWDDRLILTYI